MVIRYRVTPRFSFVSVGKLPFVSQGTDNENSINRCRCCLQKYAEGMAWPFLEFAIERFSSRLDELWLEDVISNEELPVLLWMSDCEIVRFSK